MNSAASHITKHAFKRSKERLGWNKATTTRMVEVAIEKGIEHKETAGRLNRYLSKLYLTEKKANNIRIYGEHIYLFHDLTLITVLSLPNIFKRHVHSIGEMYEKN